VVTQPSELQGRLTRLFKERGAEVLEVPGVRFAAPTDPRPLLAALSSLRDYDWILFSNQVSAELFFDWIARTRADWREGDRAGIGAFGPLTAKKLGEMGVRVDAIAVEHLGPQIHEAMTARGDIRQKRVMLIRPEGAGAEIPRYLTDAGARVDDLACYRAEVESEDPNGAAAQLMEEGADWITFAGYFDMDYFRRRFDLVALRKRFRRLKLATIGPKSAKLVSDLGLQADACAAIPTMEALVSAVEEAVKS
jgi:uroporphyrinogen III methyltransferase / synthase